MKYLTILICFLSINLSSCQTDFDKDVWLKNNDIKITNNPRKDMVDDLMSNYLKKGMTKSDVLDLLGKPKGMGLGTYIPKGLRLPDSLNINNYLEQSDKEIDAILEKSGKWYKENSIEAYFVNYHLGWKLVDPLLLRIKFNENEIVDDFWVKQY